MQMSLYPLRMERRPIAAAVDALRALGESSRLRIVAVLRHGELTVTDLTEVLGQSQPRVSRHLRVLFDAGMIVKHREGSWSFFRLADDAAALVDDVLAHVDPGDADVAHDRARLDDVRRRRAVLADEYFEQIASSWDEERALHASVDAVEAAIVDAVGDVDIDRLVDLGTGTGRMLQLLGAGSTRALGVDASHSMLSVARANLDDETLRHCELRQGDVYRPPLDAQSFDLAIVHQVLHYLDDPERAIAEAARLLAPGGRLLVVDFAPHQHEFLRADHAHLRLGFSHEQLRGYALAAGLGDVELTDLEPPAGNDGLTVTICVARADDVEADDELEGAA